MWYLWNRYRRTNSGDNSKKNIVLLTAREHFLAHYLLVKIYQNTPFRYKMSYALSCLSRGFTTQDHGYMNSRLFASLRQNLGEMLSDETKRKIGEANRKHFENPEYCAKISAIHTGKKPTEEVRQLLSKRAFERSTSGYREKIRQVRLGTKASKESRKKCSESMKKVWALRKENA